MLVAAMLGASTSLAATALQQPPVLVPAEYDRTIDGYEIGPFYQRWVRWIETRKDAAFEAMLTEPEDIAGESVRHQPIIEYSWNDDSGPFLAGDVHAYCRLDGNYRRISGSCHYRLRRVRNDHESDKAGDPLNLWARQSFNPEMLVRRLRDLNWVPGASIYGSEARVFSTLPSPIPTLIESSARAQVDSRDCPAMARALAALDQRRLAWRMDLTEVGEDGRVPMLGAHGAYVVYRVTVRTPGGEVTLNGAGNALDALAGPVVRAADACMDAQAGSTGRHE
jgi:hypothetical protein